jgi:hypothetical protein
LSTSPPTTAAIDAWAGTHVIQQLVARATAFPGVPATAFVFAFTENDGTPVFQMAGDPTAVEEEAQVAYGILTPYGPRH